MEKGRGRGRGEWEAKTVTSSMMKTRGVAPHVGTAAFSPSLEQYALRLLARRADIGGRFRAGAAQAAFVAN